MISHEHKFIYIHIPKTGGTSIERKLALPAEKGWHDHRTLRELEPLTPGHALTMHRESHLRLLAKRVNNVRHGRSRVTAAQYRSYYKFSIVRNPWGRVFSWYKNVRRDSKHRARLGVREDCSFKEFVQRHMEHCSLRPQTFWMMDHRGEIPMDFVGRFERLSDDFASVCARLGIKDASLPHTMRGDGAPYTEAFDDETRELVARRYAAEIGLYGFEFGA